MYSHHQGRNGTYIDQNIFRPNVSYMFDGCIIYVQHIMTNISEPNVSYNDQHIVVTYIVQKRHIVSTYTCYKSTYML